MQEGRKGRGRQGKVGEAGGKTGKGRGKAGEGRGRQGKAEIRLNSQHSILLLKECSSPLQSMYLMQSHLLDIASSNSWWSQLGFLKEHIQLSLSRRIKTLSSFQT